MRFVIVGYGRVGRRTARILTTEGHEVTIVDNDESKVERARTDGFETVQGDAASEDVLVEASTPDADAIGGLTGDLNTNFTACMVGNEYGCRTVLRIDADYREEIYETYAADVDDIIYPERLGAAGAKTALLGGDFNVITDLTEQLSVASVTIPEGSPIVGERVVRVDLPSDARIYAHGRHDEPMTIPLPRTAIEPGDQIAILSDQNTLTDVRTALKGT